ncbi:hypothetical protein BASA83_006980 [Batrachochytrium salamandrivorans]|nr:hypothetical protein BASA83_006980 [Batrachochytrium salamandrivorans]
MKLISFFVAAMVITSVNAGRFGELWRKITSVRGTEPPVTSSSSVTFSWEQSSSLEQSSSSWKNLSQQVAAQQAEMDALRNTIALQQKATANLEKILSNMASQAASTSEATQAALAAILARLEVKPVVSPSRSPQ